MADGLKFAWNQGVAARLHEFQEDHRHDRVYPETWSEARTLSTERAA